MQPSFPHAQNQPQKTKKQNNLTDIHHSTKLQSEDK